MPFDSPPFTCRQVSDAIPIPGLLEALGPSVRAARAAAATSLLPLPPLPSGAQAVAAAASLLPPGVRDLIDGPGGGRLARAGLALDQLGMVAGEVGDGSASFTPSPTECRRLVATQYSVSRVRGRIEELGMELRCLCGPLGVD